MMHVQKISKHSTYDRIIEYAKFAWNLKLPINDQRLFFNQIAFSNHNGSCLRNDASFWVDYSPGSCIKQ